MLRAPNEGRTVSAADSAAVLTRGGRILHAFNVGVLRAFVDTSALRSLLDDRSGIASLAYVVGDTSRRDVSLHIFFDHTLQTEDSLAIARLGGRTQLLRAGLRKVVGVLLADSMIARARTLDGVTLVRAQAIDCVVLTPGEDW